MRRCYDRVVLTDEVDRVAMVPDLVALEKRLEKRLEQRIKEDGETTRRHFDIMVEKVQDAVKIVAEVNAHHAVVLHDHEHRLKRVEGTR